MFFVCVLFPFPVEVLKGQSLIQGLLFVPFSSGNGKRKGMRKGIAILLQLIREKKKDKALATFKRTKECPSSTSECFPAKFQRL